ncbi:DUF4870 domain-containing protein [Candidatus Omnitrophota bacterium]
MGKDVGKTSTGMSGNVAALLCYVPFISLIAAIVFIIVEKENKFVRFHAMQSIILSAAIIVLSLIPVVNIVMLVVGPLSLILYIVLMIKSYQGEQMKLPLVGDMAEKHS